jgi:transposase
MEEKKSYTYLGIDVAKATLRVQTPNANFEVSNDIDGITSICKECSEVNAPLVVFEATGGYERLLKAQLQHNGIDCNMVAPALVRHFIHSQGIKAKNDPIDARMLVRFAQERALQPMVPSKASNEQLRILLDRRAQLVDMRSQEKTRLQNSPQAVLADIRSLIRDLDKHVSRIEDEINKLIKSDPDLKDRNEVITDISGLGNITAYSILAYLPEITSLSRNTVCALAGLAPFDNDSGKKSGKRHIYGGRAKVRTSLYMATVSAMTHNEVIKAYVDRLKAANKPAKCAIVAGMRKMLLHVRAQLIRYEKGTLKPRSQVAIDAESVAC